jgi:glycosyltransferase involved in cell wall biosynthesis
VSVVIATHTRAALLPRAIDSALGQDVEPEVLVVDDGSRDDTRAIARRFAPLVKLVESETSNGPGAARNRGVAAARGRVLAFTDADCYPAPDWLTRGLAALERVDLVQGSVAPDPAAQRAPFDRTVVVDAENGFYQTANLLMRRELFDAVGGFHDWALNGNGRPDRRRARAARTPIGEDTQFAWAARRGGASTAFAPDAVVHHAVVPGGLRDQVADAWHWSRDMPGLARRVPELRERCFHRRLFFSRKTMRFDLALAGVAAAAIMRRPLPLVAALPYADWIAREAIGWGGRAGVRHALGSAVSDAATCAGLVNGSVRHRCPLL